MMVAPPSFAFFFNKWRIWIASGHEDDLLKVWADPGDSGDTSKVWMELSADATCDKKLNSSFYKTPIRRIFTDKM